MENKILGLHHITAIAGNAQQNYDFYTKLLGLRLVKKTVNFDDPGTYHFYYGNEMGSPGTILTFFPWQHIKRGFPGVGMATEIGFSAPSESFDFWMERFKQYNVKHEPVAERFGEKILQFTDPDGLILNFIIPKSEDKRTAWTTSEVTANVAVKGFHSVTLTLRNIKATSGILTDIFGYKLLNQEDNRYRFVTDAIDNANVVDLVEIPNGHDGVVAGGTNHHVAFRVKDDNILMEFRKKIIEQGFNITDKIDRNYFYSLYFREPGGVLFELASENPGFAIDEPANELGLNLKLPAQYESLREKIENALPFIIA